MPSKILCGETTNKINLHEISECRSLLTLAEELVLRPGLLEVINPRREVGVGVRFNVPVFKVLSAYGNSTKPGVHTGQYRPSSGSHRGRSQC